MPIPPAMICECLRCSHAWIKRIEGRPVRCPKCKQPNWDLPRRKVGRPSKDIPAGKLKRGRPKKKTA